MNDTKEQLEKSIKLAKHRLKKFTKEKLLSAEANLAYNRLVIEKAVLSKQLETLNESKFENFVKKIIRKLTNKKRICDSF